MMDDASPEPARERAVHAGESPSRWIARFAHLVPARARVLDLACGRGRHAKFFAARGAHVVAVDRDAAALDSLSSIPGVQVRQADLEAAGWPLAGERFDAIVVANYLHRPRFAQMLDLLAGDGALLYETFAVGNEAFGRPGNRDFLLDRDELADRVRGRLVIVAFEQGLVNAEGRNAVVQRIAAVGPTRAWPPALP
jgi:SAM-dependent methyltransferase